MIREEVKNNIVKSVRKKFGDVEIPVFSLKVTENPEHGDYATNVAMLLAAVLRKKPMEVALALSEELRHLDGEIQISPALPGFINFRLSGRKLGREFSEIFKKKEKFGSGKKKKEKIQVEFISANPTGPLTLANGRGGFLGDALANVLKFYGYEVEREYYVNDTGNQILTLGKSLLAAGGIIPIEEAFYKAEYIKVWALANGELILKYQNNPMALGEAAAADFLRSIKKIIRGAGISFDRFTSEKKDIRNKDLISKVLSIFQANKVIYEKDGALWLKTSDFGDDKDRVLVTSDKFPTYLLADAGHYLETKKRKFGAKINILGPDHYGYVGRIQAVAKLVGLKKSVVIVTQAVRLMKNGEEFKMSKRKGQFVTFEELLNEVNLGAMRYFFLERSADAHIDFDLELAKKRSVKNPVYYVQYAHARISSILKKTRRINLKSGAGYKLLTSLEEQILIKKLIQFPEVVEDTARDYQVHRLTRYALELAGIFHNFYEKHRVITDDKKTLKARLSLVTATKIVLKNTLSLLGIESPEKM